MSLKLLLFVLIGLVYFGQSVQGNACNKVLGNFADKNMRFIGCAVEGSEPVKICQDCVEKFHELESTYSSISLTLDTNNVSCSKRYLNLDKLNILETVHLNSVNLWTTANCEACFITPGNSTISEFGIKFLNYSTQTDQCLISNVTNKCEKCEKWYLTLNEWYERERKENKLCFDFEDIMNKTRLKWSGTYKCCMDKKDSLTAFVVTASILSSIPIIFYIGLYFYGMMQNTYYEHLDISDVSGQGSINTVTASTANPGPSSTISGTLAHSSTNEANSLHLSRRSLPELPKPKKISNRPNLMSEMDSDD